MTGRGLLAASLLLAALLGAAAARAPSNWERAESALRARDGSGALQWLRRGLDGARGAQAPARAGEADEEAIVAIKYEVPPSLHKDFIDAWGKLEKSTFDERGVAIFDLKKTFGDNLYFWAYGEWDSYEDYLEHFKSDYTSDWLNFLAERDILWELLPLKNVTDNAAAHREQRGSGLSVGVGRHGKKGGGGDDPRKQDAHVVIQYHVAPSKADDFVNAWTEAATETWEEEDNSIYALRRFATLNHHFIAYGTWKSYDSYWDHFTSKHISKLRQFLADNDILWYAEALKKLGDQPEAL